MSTTTYTANEFGRRTNNAALRVLSARERCDALAIAGGLHSDKYLSLAMDLREARDEYDGLRIAFATAFPAAFTEYCDDNDLHVHHTSVDVR